MRTRTVGRGRHVFKAVSDWANLPKGREIRDAAGIAVDSQDRVFVFHRGSRPMLVFDRDGNFLESWGDGLFSRAHSVKTGPDGMLYCVDVGDHTVRKTGHSGDVLMTLGRPGKPSPTGATGLDYREVKQAAGPFNRPTDIAFGQSGEMFVSDGYGNARIHKFTATGQLLSSWGGPGARPGEFNLPHGIAVDSGGRVLVADRENSRVQVFDSEGGFVNEWTDANRPAGLVAVAGGRVAVVEMGYTKDNMYEGNPIPADRDPFPRLTIRSGDGSILAEWGGRERCAPGGFFAPHMIAVDSRGDLYVAEVTFATKAPPGCHPVQKFVRQ